MSWDRGATLADRFRRHAGDAPHLYGVLLRGMADDWEAGGPTRAVFAGHEDAPSGAALQLRVLAGLFRLVLTGRADALRPWYPCLGGTEPAATAWPVARAVLAAHAPELRRSLAIPPQTNEVGRSAALLAGLADLVETAGVSRVRLLELGASAGLNLLLDRMHVTGDGWAWGPADSPLTLRDAITGRGAPPPFTLLDRAGCDLAPVDPASEQGRVLLTSFVWPFDVHRHERLAAALRLAAAHPVPVERAGAAAWLPGQLARAPEEDVLTVVWHSVTQLYWPAEEVAAVRALLGRHGAVRRLGEVSLEYDEDDPASGGMPVLRTRLWEPFRPGSPRERRLGTAHHHGVPVRLTP